MADKKNMNKLIITGDYDKLMIIMQRFQTLGVTFEHPDLSPEEIGKLGVAETQENTTERLQKVVNSGQSAQMAPNLVNHDAFPNDNLDKAIRSIAATGADLGEKERRKEAHKENAEQIKTMNKIEKNRSNVSQGKTSTKVKEVEADKSDKSAGSRSTKEEKE